MDRYDIDRAPGVDPVARSLFAACWTILGGNESPAGHAVNYVGLLLAVNQTTAEFHAEDDDTEVDGADLVDRAMHLYDMETSFEDV